MDWKSKAAIGIGGLAVITLGYFGCSSYKDHNEFEEKSEQIYRCLNKAAGEDHLIGFDEGVKLARGFNYFKAPLANELITLQMENNKPVLYVGWMPGVEPRDKRYVSSEEMSRYLASTD